MLNYKIESDITFPAAKARLSPLSSLLPVKTVESDLPESDLDGAHVHPAPSTGRNTRTSAMARKSTPEGSPVVTTLPTPSADKIRTLARSSTDSQNRQTASIFSWTQDDTKSEGASSSERGPESPDSPNNRKYLQDASASPLFNMKKR